MPLDKSHDSEEKCQYNKLFLSDLLQQNEQNSIISGSVSYQTVDQLEKLLKELPSRGSGSSQIECPDDFYLRAIAFERILRIDSRDTALVENLGKLLLSNHEDWDISYAAMRVVMVVPDIGMLHSFESTDHLIDQLKYLKHKKKFWNEPHFPSSLIDLQNIHMERAYILSLEHFGKSVKRRFTRGKSSSVPEVLPWEMYTQMEHAHLSTTPREIVNTSFPRILKLIDSKLLENELYNYNLGKNDTTSVFLDLGAQGK